VAETDPEAELCASVSSRKLLPTCFLGPWEDAAEVGKELCVPVKFCLPSLLQSEMACRGGGEGAEFRCYQTEC
jgi:hypothetical protein